jgi:2-deoxy-D-gluconate 3-dehydrogenase
MLNFRLDNKIAIVTGCNKGIGLEIAKSMAEQGADIIGVSSKMRESGQAVAELVKNAGRNFYAYNADFTNRESIYNFIKEVQTHHPRIDILINNAGNIRRAPAAEHSDEYWDEIININLDAQFIIAREIGKQMIANNYGKIVFTASLLSFQGGINVPGYAASKGAVASLIKALANEWAKFGINVNDRLKHLIRHHLGNDFIKL